VSGEHARHTVSHLLAWRCRGYEVGLGDRHRATGDRRRCWGKRGREVQAFQLLEGKEMGRGERVSDHHQHDSTSSTFHTDIPSSPFYLAFPTIVSTGPYPLIRPDRRAILYAAPNHSHAGRVARTTCRKQLRSSRNALAAALTPSEGPVTVAFPGCPALGRSMRTPCMSCHDRQDQGLAVGKRSG
jgi:hypothetical protein